MKVKNLDDEYAEVTTEFLKDIEAFIYNVTEHEIFGSFQNYIPVKDAAINLHNELAKELISLGCPNYDWVFMLPNCLLFSALGFAAGLKNENNFEFIEEKSELLCENYRQTIEDLDLLNEFKYHEQ